MHVNIGSTALMAAAVASQQARMQTAIQLEIVKSAAENQQTMVEILRTRALGFRWTSWPESLWEGSAESKGGIR